MLSPQGEKIVQSATHHLQKFMYTIVNLDESDWDKISLDMGENRRVSNYLLKVSLWAGGLFAAR